MKVLRNGKAIEPPAPLAGGSAEAMRDAAAKVAHGFTLEANQGANRLIVPASWVVMSPSQVYNLGADDAATFIGEDIRALPLPEPPDPRDALIGTDVSDAAIADATIARLSADLAAAREALEEADEIINEGFWESPSRQWMERVNASFVKTRAALAKLAKGA